MYQIFSDGGSRGNPGPSAYAIVVTKDDKVIFKGSEYLGINTNNYAEYRGLIAGLTKAIELKAENVDFIMDSQLVIKQMNGEYKVKAENIKNLYLDAKALSSMIPNIRFRNVRRTEMLIPMADALLNIELDNHQ
ncbi:ribonuclease HI [Candidatus Methanoplasma termitum]|uniref:RnhA protein n=1 Tax=Candidatus Methanoplasma termitum TaxID=1577791 RepID=A0A0A7LCF2_9ARCH|nr:ribonuclease HI family protein [Candidatus Methanoplasma termitum]AIZ56658.1 ribonuclease HI [Candidatus Methanoplasma termitum]MCL2333418.1 ribonuclease HI family protein [Candidatus Methanoplasma sp.]